MYGDGSSFHKASERYIAHGNQRPPAEKLSSYALELEDQDRPTTALTHADILLDLALADPDNAETHLQQAKARLTELIHQVDVLETANFHSEVARYAGAYIQACLRLGELPNWLQAVQKETVALAYPAMLHHANQAIDYICRNGDWGHIKEFMPILLLARAQHRDGAGYVGRLSLLREDTRRFSPSTATNTSWDCGISFTADAESFLEPSHKLQIKSSKGRNLQKYRKAGLICLTATVHGFQDPIQIIDSCLAEQTPGSTKEGFLTSDELDKTTADILQATKDQAALINKASTNRVTRL